MTNDIMKYREYIDIIDIGVIRIRKETPLNIRLKIKIYLKSLKRFEKEQERLI